MLCSYPVERGQGRKTHYSQLWAANTSYPVDAAFVDFGAHSRLGVERDLQAQRRQVEDP